MHTQNELTQKMKWIRIDRWDVSSELFFDLVLTHKCNCDCPWCIARTKECAPENRNAWECAVQYAFSHFPVKSVILLGGEATLDPAFFDKVRFVESSLSKHSVEHLILTTNGIRLTDEAFLKQFLATGIDSVNLSRMHWDQKQNDRIFGAATPTIEQIGRLYNILHKHGKTLRINVNVWKNNLDNIEDQLQMIRSFFGICDAIKFTPLMRTDMFNTLPEVTAYTAKIAMSENDIRALFDRLSEHGQILSRNNSVFGFIEYAELDFEGQRVLLKYAQVEDKYDRNKQIPTLKLYQNGCLSNEWSCSKDIRQKN